MLAKSIRILNFDDSIIKQKNLLARYESAIFELSDIGPKVRYWMNNRMRNLIEKRIRNSSRNSVTFLGSGDFHHVSEILIGSFQEPLCVIIFDFHPNWDVSSFVFNCGNWVSRVLQKKNVLKLILLGVSSQDISGHSVASGNLASLKDNRVEIYPYSHEPSKVFYKRVPDNVSITVKRDFLSNTIYWNELKNKNMTDFFNNLLGRISTKNVYVSIDKDCLKNDYALTNWDQGQFNLEELLLLLNLIKTNFDMIGLDITGDYSPLFLKGIIKKIVSRSDHPDKVKAQELPDYFVTSVNENTNLKILEILGL